MRQIKRVQLEAVLIAILGLLPGGLAQDFLTNGLVAYYPLDGSARDATGNGNDGAINGAIIPATDRFGQTNGCLRFPGSAYIKAKADNLPTGARTVSLWFNADTVDSRPVLLGYGGDACGTTFFMSINDGGQHSFTATAHCGVGTLADYYAAPPVSAWTHWVVTIDASLTARMYLNGKLVATGVGSFPVTVVANRDLALGVDVSGNGQAPYTDGNVGWFQGLMANVRIYSRALSLAEVGALYHLEARVQGNLAISVKTVRVDMFVEVGKTYQLEGSSDLASWTPVGAPFQAAAPVVSQDVDVTQTGQYFRLEQMP